MNYNNDDLSSFWNPEPQLGESKGWYNRGFIPHFDQLETYQFITFRLSDSLPQSVLDELIRFDVENTSGEKARLVEKYLDSGYGCCALGNTSMAKTLQETLKIHHGKKYDLVAWCVMPNHVHVLINQKESLGKILQSWKSYTGRWAKKHNQELGLGILEGHPLWMRDYFDRFIRSVDHYNYVIDYIHNNPVKAGLCENSSDWMWSSAYDDS
ncbi:MAG: transposase [Lentisphaerales bacterium]|nr:transposase [Lentisphaerales bacterium]